MTIQEFGRIERKIPSKWEWMLFVLTYFVLPTTLTWGYAHLRQGYAFATLLSIQMVIVGVVVFIFYDYHRRLEREVTLWDKIWKPQTLWYWQDNAHQEHWEILTGKDLPDPVKNGERLPVLSIKLNGVMNKLGCIFYPNFSIGWQLAMSCFRRQAGEIAFELQDTCRHSCRLVLSAAQVWKLAQDSINAAKVPAQAICCVSSGIYANLTMKSAWEQSMREARQTLVENGVRAIQAEEEKEKYRLRLEKCNKVVAWVRTRVVPIPGEALVIRQIRESLEKLG